MSSGELFDILEEKITPSGKVLYAHKGTLVVAGGRSDCALALVERERGFNTEHAVFIFSSETSELKLKDLSCDQVLPVNSNFICDFTPSDDDSDVRVQFTDGGGLAVDLELPSHPNTDEFISQLFAIVDNSNSNSSWTNRKPVLMADCTNMDDIILNQSEMGKGVARDKMIRHQMGLKFNEYTYCQSIKVQIATWNVNGKQATVSLVDWLNVDSDAPDVYAIGFQELDLSKEAFLFNDTPREEEWLRAVVNALAARKTPYTKICLTRLVGMMLIVFVKKSNVNYVKNVAYETVGTGLMGKMGNKGAVGVRFDFHSTSMCFVNSHLAAHVEEFERRNQDYNDITARMVFSVPGAGAQNQQRCTIKDHDQIFWLGDLNYRVTDMDPKDVKQLLEMNEFKPVLVKDQLLLQKKQRKIFEGFHEGEINFQPTYKYDTGTDNWDSSEKNRAPAWCDRILWKGAGIEQINYRSHPTLRISDHKPVTSLFTAQVRIIDEAKQRKVQEDVIKYLDKLENEWLPQVMVDTNEIVFDTVRYNEPVSHELIIANTGQVPAQFEFINKLDDVSFCKPWLHVEPSKGCILPCDKCDVKLEVYVNKRTACKFNAGEEKLYDILVLHLLGGKDIFITVTGNYERSCFGSSIEALVHVSVPISEIPIGRLIALENNKEALSGQDPYPIPKEIWFLVDHLYRHGLKQTLFVQPGLHSELLQIRNWLDYGSSDPLPGSVLSIAEALLLLLDSTPEPVIPYNMLQVCLNSSSVYSSCKQFERVEERAAKRRRQWRVRTIDSRVRTGHLHCVLRHDFSARLSAQFDLMVQSLPEHRKNVFLYLCVFLQELLAHSSDNDLDPKSLAIIFGGIFLRDPPMQSKDRVAQIDNDKKKCNFVHHFLINDQSYFNLGR